MEQYLIIIDLDGTTLNDDKTINSITLKAIEQVSLLGHKVVISTGRSFYASNHYYKQLKLDTLIVNRNGAHIHHPTYNVVKSALINKRVLKEIVESDYFQSIVEMYIEVGKDLYVEKGKMEYFSHNRYEFINIFYNHEIHDCNAIILLVENDLVDEIERFLNRLGDIRVDVWRHQGEYKTTMMEIFSKEVDKVKGIDFLCDYYQIPLERTIAIGDQVNDIEMIKYAGMGVAVSNAIEPLKEVADVVLNKTNNEGAVGLYLSEIFHIDLNMIDIL